jgi:MoxR-like ATPase
MNRLLMGVLTGGHLLLEGVPGLAKTLSVKTLAETIQAQFKRIQFTPDLLPSDLIGTLIYNAAKQEFYPKFGPIFSNLVLADEINRAPAKVQSALLEAMQEKQVTIGDTTHALSPLFLVLATQNPIEQEGTYPLPEAQVDRFLMKLKVTYPSREEEKEILNRMTVQAVTTIQAVVSPEEILSARKTLDIIYVDDKLKEYVLDVISATRFPEKYKLAEAKRWIQFGASPRATISLVQAAKANAFLNHRGYVTPEDIKAIAKDVLRHRIMLTFEAEAEEKTAESIIDHILAEIEIP